MLKCGMIVGHKAPPPVWGCVSRRFMDVCLQLMWLQFEVVRGPVGVVWGRLGAGLGLFWAQTGPKLA